MARTNKPKGKRPPVAKAPTRPATARKRKPVTPAPPAARQRASSPPRQAVKAPQAGPKRPPAKPMPVKTASHKLPPQKSSSTSKPKPGRLPPVVLDDPLDMTPTPAFLDIKPTPLYPGVYYGTHKGAQSRSCIAYKRTDSNVWTIMFATDGGKRVVVKWGAETFDANMVRLHFPHHVGPVYPLSLALSHFLEPNAIYDDDAWRVLNRLAKGQDPDLDDNIDDLLDMNPSPIKRVLSTRQRDPLAKVERRTKRKEKLAKMNPVELRAWRDKRNARRKIRRMKQKKEK